MQQLTEEQKKEICLILSVGCSRDTAARYVGCPSQALAEAVLADGAFARNVARAEAGIELAHMRSVQQAARDEKHWRASVWWLERKAPDHYARRGAEVVTATELKRVVQAIGKAIAVGVRDNEERNALLASIEQLAQQHELGGLSDPTKAGGE